jgi:formylglycine-generating enzyme required for sulfatase activity
MFKQSFHCAFFLITIGILLNLCCTNSETNPYEKPFGIDYKTTEKVFKIGIPVAPDTPKVGGQAPITFRIAPALPSGLVFDTSTGAIEGTPKDTLTKTSFTVTAINSAGTSSVQIFITVLPAGPQSLHYSVDSAIYFVNVPISENKPMVSGGIPSKYESSSTLPSGLQLDITKGTIYGTPVQISPKAHYTIIASNPGGTTQTTISIAVIAAIPSNHPPEFIAGMQNRTMSQGETLTLKLVAHDQDTADSLRFALSNGDSLRSLFIGMNSAIQLSVLHDTAVLIFSPGSRSGNYPFKVALSDGIDNISTTIVVSVGNVNRPPAWTQKMLQDTIDEGQTFSLSLKDSCNDPEGKPLTFILKAGKPAVDTITATGTYRYSPGYSDSGYYVIKIAAVDDSLLSDTLTLYLYVVNVDNDHKEPTIRLLSPARDSSISSDNSMTVRVVATDSSGVARVSFSTGAAIFEGTNSSDTIWSATISGLQVNYNKIVTSGWDKSANMNQSRDSFFIKYDPTVVDNRPPIFRPIAGIISDTLIRQPMFTSTFEFKDTSGVDSIYWTVNGLFAGLMTPVNGMANQYLAIDTLTKYHANRVVLRAMDKSSNRNRDSIVITIDYNTAPSIVTLSSPSDADGVTEVPVPVTVSWSGGSDPDGDSVIFKVWYGLTQDKMTGQTVAGGTRSAQLRGLAENRLYYWKVVGYSVPRPQDSVASEIRSFGTFNIPPQVALQLPANGAKRQQVDGLNLQFAAADADGDSVTYTVLVGTNRTLTSADQKVTLWGSNTYLLNGLQNAKAYYWRVIAKEKAGGYTQKSDTSAVDSFYTVNRAPVWNIPTAHDTMYYRISIDLHNYATDPDGSQCNFRLITGKAQLSGSILIFPADSQLVSLRAYDNFSAQPESADIAFRKYWFKNLFMATIPAGQFVMGGSRSDANQPHTVKFSQGFFMDSTEVTQQECKVLLGDSLSKYTIDGSHPVDNATWFDAILFCNSRSKAHGFDSVYIYESKLMSGAHCTSMVNIRIQDTISGYRLPTEAQWEYACRAGTSSKFFWGDIWPGDYNQYVWWYCCSNPQKVHQKKCNPWGLYDIVGNVAEWCFDWYVDNYVTAGSLDPVGPATGTTRVIRGASFMSFSMGQDYYMLESGYRDNSQNMPSIDGLKGFRCVLQLK